MIDGRDISDMMEIPEKHKIIRSIERLGVKRHHAGIIASAIQDLQKEAEKKSQTQLLEQTMTLS